MKISFLVTYYNQEKYVKQSLDSILALEKTCDWEIIVGDDGSIDGTTKIVNEYIKKYPDNIRLYTMPRDNTKKYDSVKRASANRLNILEHASGDIFCTLDGDDFFCDTTFVKDAIELFEKDEKISIVAFGYRYFTNGILENDITLPKKLMNQYADKNEFLKNYYIPAGGCVHKKCFGKDRIEYIKKLGYFDDNNIVINSLNYGEMYVVNRPIYAYRQTGQSVFTSMTELEQAVLNVQGMDVDLKLVDNDLQDAIIYRYATAVILMYIWKRKLRSILGEEKCKRYETGCESVMPSYCYSIFQYNAVREKKNDFNTSISKVMRMKKKYAIKQYIKFLWGEIST